MPANSPARLINHIFDSMDISRVINTYKFFGGSRSAYHPRMMLKVVIYGYLNNIYSCRKIENALNDHVSFMWLSGNQNPDRNAINHFRSSHLKIPRDLHPGAHDAGGDGILEPRIGLYRRDQDRIASQPLHVRMAQVG